MNLTSRFTLIPVTREAAEENNPRFMKRLIVGLAMAVLVSGGVGLAAPAQAGPSYWQYCPGQKWEYTSPLPPGTDLNVCHWFAATPARGPSGDVTWNLVEVDQSQLPAWAQPRQMCGFVPCQGGG
jgi:hypothetical protein